LGYGMGRQDNGYTFGGYVVGILVGGYAIWHFVAEYPLIAAVPVLGAYWGHPRELRRCALATLARITTYSARGASQVLEQAPAGWLVGGGMLGSRRPTPLAHSSSEPC